MANGKAAVKRKRRVILDPPGEGTISQSEARDAALYARGYREGREGAKSFEGFLGRLTEAKYEQEVRRAYREGYRHGRKAREEADEGEE